MGAEGPQELVEGVLVVETGIWDSRLPLIEMEEQGYQPRNDGTSAGYRRAYYDHVPSNCTTKETITKPHIWLLYVDATSHSLLRRHLARGWPERQEGHSRMDIFVHPS